MTRKIKFTKSSGNIFADLGYKDSDERLAKAKLALIINHLIKERGLKQTDAAKILGVNQPKISALARGRLKDFSIDRLIEFLNKLDQDVDITIHKKPKNRKTQARVNVELIEKHF